MYIADIPEVYGTCLRSSQRKSALLYHVKGESCGKLDDYFAADWHHPPMTSTKPRTKRQHYVPRFYLERFANSNGYVWAYDITTGLARSARPEALGAETNFYSPFKVDGTRFDDLEKWLSSVEAAAAPLFTPLSKGKRLANEDRVAMSMFIAAQYLRSPLMVNAMADMMGQKAHQMFMQIANSPAGNDKVFDEIDTKNGTLTPPEERERVRQFVSNPNNIQFDVLRDIGLPAILGVDTLAPIISDLTWVTFEARRQHVVTSDSPVAKVYDPKTYDRAYGDGGFLNKSMYATLPLDPDRVLGLFWGDGDPGGIHPMASQQVKLYNKQRALHAAKFIFSSREDAGISKLIKKHANTPRPRVTFGKPAPSIQVKRKLE